MNMMLPKFGSRAFRKGFSEGITPVGGMFGRTEFKRGEEIDTSVEAAWREVGEALSSALESQGHSVGKITGRTKSVRNRRGKR